MKRRQDLFFLLGDLDLQLGLVNEAEQEAQEALTVLGPHPEVLRRLAIVNLVKQQPEAAQVFLRAMSRDLVRGKWAREVLREVDEGSAEVWVPGVRTVRTVMLREDEARLGSGIDARCLALLKRNPHNKMAFQYLMAHYLLTRQLEAFAANLPRLRDFGYPNIPRHYEEALVIYETTMRRRVDLGGPLVSDRTLQGFADFSQAVAAAARLGDPGAAATTLAPKYGNTYFYYYTFGESGVGKR